MPLTPADAQAIRRAIASLPADVSNDALGEHAPRVEELYAPEGHAAALDPGAPIVVGARGTGKSFWAGVLFDRNLRKDAAIAYPRLGLDRLSVQFGFTGLDHPAGVGRDRLAQWVQAGATDEDARAFWWATILRALARAAGEQAPRWPDMLRAARDLDEREALLVERETGLQASGSTLLIVYDALDTVATTWPRRRLLTQALLEVVWAMRAYRAIRPKLFLRPDQIEDDALRFVELPKLRTGAVRLSWSGTDLYGLLFARLALGEDKAAFERLIALRGHRLASRAAILARRWSLAGDVEAQRGAMTELAGPYMADGPHGYKKGNTYEWPLRHLGDASSEVTPRSFLGLMIAAARHGAPPPARVLTPEGIRHGLRAASRTRVDQLHQEFPWIKGVLAPLAGLLLPKEERAVFAVWRSAATLAQVIADAREQGYLPPFPEPERGTERDLFVALERIGVMTRRTDGRLDMPDLFRVAARLLKKGGTAPL